MRRNLWASRYGALRRAIDRKLLADLEKEIAAELRQSAPDCANLRQREAIARAFGRPMQ
jgi:hypothetical protein